MATVSSGVTLTVTLGQAGIGDVVLNGGVLIASSDGVISNTVCSDAYGGTLITDLPVSGASELASPHPF